MDKHEDYITTTESQGRELKFDEGKALRGVEILPSAFLPYSFFRGSRPRGRRHVIDKTDRNYVGEVS